LRDRVVGVDKLRHARLPVVGTASFASGRGRGRVPVEGALQHHQQAVRAQYPSRLRERRSERGVVQRGAVDASVDRGTRDRQPRHVAADPQARAAAVRWLDDVDGNHRRTREQARQPGPARADVQHQPSGDPPRRPLGGPSPGLPEVVRPRSRALAAVEARPALAPAQVRIGGGERAGRVPLSVGQQVEGTAGRADPASAARAGAGDRAGSAAAGRAS